MASVLVMDRGVAKGLMRLGGVRGELGWSSKLDDVRRASGGVEGVDSFVPAYGRIGWMSMIDGQGGRELNRLEERRVDLT